MTSAIGKLIGPYRLDMPLASGALGQTLRAQHLSTGEIVAIKLFHATLSADPNFADRFRPIMQAASDIKHPNVLPIREFGQQAGQYFVVMDFISTGSLRTLLFQREARLPLRRALELARQAADGIAAAHARGTLHRDLKPENFLVEEQGSVDVVRVADFGLTRLAESGLTIDGSLGFGSYPYMSPEQLRGLQPDVRSDMYSLGIVLYEIVTGFPPFQVKTLGDALSKHLKATPEPPRTVLPSVPAGLERLILRAIEKDRANRVQTASEFSALLQEEIAKLPGKPLVVWRGSAVAGGTERVIPKKDEALTAVSSATVSKHFPVSPLRVQQGDLTLPPSDEQKGAAFKTPRELSGDSRRIGIVLDRDTLNLVPGQLGVLSVTLMNTGHVVDAFGLTVRGVDESWVQTPSQPQRLNPGQRAVVPLSITVPRKWSSRAGTYTVSIVAGSRMNPGEERSAPATWTVQPFAQTMLALSPPRARGWRTGDFAVELSNQGNTPGKYSLSTTDDEKALGYSLPTSDLALDPGATRNVPLGTSMRLRPMGTADVRTFTVTAKSEFNGTSEPPKAVVGQFVHRALIPMWLPPVVLLAGAAAFLFISRRNQTNLTVVPAVVQVPIGSSSPVVATLTNANNEAIANGPPVTWASNDTLIARVSSTGVVTGVKVGSTLITAKAGRKTQTVQVGVIVPQVAEVALSARKLNLTVGATASVRATAKDGNGRVLARDAIWSSSDASVATVGGGRITAKAPGTAVITAQIESKSAAAEIEVVPPKIGAVDPKGPEDCIAYEPASIGKPSKDKVVGWRVTDGSAVIATLDNESEAQQVIALARRYKGHCFIGRGNTRPNHNDYVVDYWVAPTNVPSIIPKEDCHDYDRGSLVIKEVGAAGFSVEDRNTRLAFADTRADAKKIWDIAKEHLALCVIARNNTRPNRRDYMVQYWR
jgi:serine/threonine protein kinase/uncharacterized protein YjdB